MMKSVTMPFILLCLTVFAVFFNTHADAQQKFRNGPGFETRIQPITSTETRTFYDSATDTAAKILEEQKKTATALTDISIVLKDMLAEKKGIEKNSRRSSSEGTPGTMREEIALIRQSLDDLKQISAKQTELDVMLVKLIREQLRITKTLFSQDIPASASPLPVARETDGTNISGRISVKESTGKNTQAAEKDDSIWVIR